MPADDAFDKPSPLTMRPSNAPYGCQTRKIVDGHWVQDGYEFLTGDPFDAHRIPKMASLWAGPTNTCRSSLCP